MKCPRCQTDLKDVTIDNNIVKACSRCEGTWYPGEALGEVTDHTLAEIEKSDLQPALVADHLELVDLDEPINCPQCQRPMMRYRYTMTCDVVLDECLEHGVWLDDGELGSLMAFLEDLYQGVEKERNKLASGVTEKNLEYLEELSRSPASYNLPGSVLEALHQVHRRQR